jgi:hypothetical protein
MQMPSITASYLAIALLMGAMLLSRLPWAVIAEQMSAQIVATIHFIQVIHIILTL